MARMMTGTGLALIVALAGVVAPAQAQRRGVGGPGEGDGPNVGRAVELALEHQESLELSGEQIAQLEELNGILKNDVTPLAQEMKTLREGMRSGDVPRDEGFRQMEALRGRLITAAAPIRGRVQEILTVAQHRSLQAEVRQGRPNRGRGMGGPGMQRLPRRPGGGMAPGRGMGPRRGGPGFGPRGVQMPPNPPSSRRGGTELPSPGGL